jgi:hypothetical protein
VRNVIILLLSRNPGARGTPTSLKNHIWFRGFDWEALHNKQMKTEFRPQLQKINKRNVQKGTVQQICKKDEDQERIPPGKTTAPVGWDCDF